MARRRHIDGSRRSPKFAVGADRFLLEAFSADDGVRSLLCRISAAALPDSRPALPQAAVNQVELQLVSDPNVMRGEPPRFALRSMPHRPDEWRRHTLRSR